MGRTGRRVSRALIACLAVTLALGIVFWLHNTSKSTAAPQPTGQAVVAEAASGNVAEAPKVATPVVAKPAAVAPTPSAPKATPVALATPTTSPASTATPPAAISQADAAAILGSRTPTPVSAQPLIDAQAKIDQGNTLEARNILLAAFVSKTLSPADYAAVKAKLKEINEKVVFSRTFYSNDEFGGSYKVQPGDTLGKIAREHDVTADLLAHVNGIDPKRLQAGKSIKIIKGPFHAVVDKSDFTIDLWIGPPEERGSMYVTTYKVGLGSNDSTPTGTWIVTGKLTNPAYYSPRGEGVFQPDDPKNPLGEYWMSLQGIDGKAVGAQSYGIHGTIEPDSIGKQSSMGCIRMLNAEVAKVYEVLVDGKSTVIVRD